MKIGVPKETAEGERRVALVPDTVSSLTSNEIGRLRSGQVLIGHLAPLTSAETNRAIAAAGVTAFAIEAIPRTTRAQSMDALSSQANLAGYAAALLAAREAGRLFPVMTIAAGTIAPAKV